MVATLFIFVMFGSGLSLASYTVPEPLVQVFGPKGLEVSIPHTAGIELFAFHGNINKPMDGLAAGQLSKDILRREGNLWKFQDNSIQLQIGDNIYYWLFVIKDGIGHRLDNGVYHIQAITARNGTTNVQPKKGFRDDDSASTNLKICESVLLNLTDRYVKFDDELKQLRETNHLYKDLIYKHPDSATQLTLDGRFSPKDEPIQIVTQVIRQRLGLFTNIEAAEKTTKGAIRFNVATLEDKVAVIQRARERLKGTLYSITY